MTDRHSRVLLTSLLGMAVMAGVPFEFEAPAAIPHHRRPAQPPSEPTPQPRTPAEQLKRRERKQRRKSRKGRK